MKIIFVPLYRFAVSYAVEVGRRWTLVEQIILLELADGRRTTHDLAESTQMPDRLVVEALINLMRASWVEVRTTDSGTFFAATAVGRKRAAEKELPASLEKDVRWISACFDRVTGCWLRADDLDLVYVRDLPNDAHIIETQSATFNEQDPSLRDLFVLDVDETLVPARPQFRSPSMPYARVGVAFGKVQSGLPSDAPLRLTQKIIDTSSAGEDSANLATAEQKISHVFSMSENISENNIIVGGAQHLTLLREILSESASYVVIHSCFLSPTTLRLLKPDLERAAKRNVRIELLWGFISDPEKPKVRHPFAESDNVIKEMPESLRSRVQLSSLSTGSHSKFIVYDDRASGKWVSVIGSCNFLSSQFDWVEASLRSFNQRLASKLLGYLVEMQLPASGGWGPTARRLNRLWSRARQRAVFEPLSGTHAIQLLSDQDHYAVVTRARDEANGKIELGCDLYGLAAETSVIVPMETAAGLKKSVRLVYCRASKTLVEEGRTPDAAALSDRGISLENRDSFHAKYLMWDDDTLALTSFNWCATVSDGARVNGAELGVLITGPLIADIFARKMRDIAGQ